MHEPANACSSITCKLEFVGISILFKNSHAKNADLHILETFDGIEILLIVVYENALKKSLDLKIFKHKKLCGL